MMLMVMRVSDDGVQMVPSPVAVVILDVRPAVIAVVNLQEPGDVVVVRLVVILRLGMVERMRMMERLVTMYLEEKCGKHLGGNIDNHLLN